MNQQQAKDFIFLNLAMFFISTSGVLGRYVSLSPPLTIFWRGAFAAVFLVGICKWRKIIIFKETKKDIGIFALSGFLMMIHWVAYFYALQLSNVAIGMLSLFTYPVITAILEPILLGTKFQKMHLFLGLLTLLGVYFLAPNNNAVTSEQFLAIACGVLSAVSYAFRNILMKNSVQNHDSMKLMAYQTLIIALVLSPFAFLKGTTAVLEEWWVILLLALFTTVIGHSLFLMSFKRFSITTASIMSCTQPIFGILLGVVFLREYPTMGTCFGGGLILISVIIESYYSMSAADK